MENGNNNKEVMRVAQENDADGWNMEMNGDEVFVLMKDIWEKKMGFFLSGGTFLHLVLVCFVFVFFL